MERPENWEKIKEVFGAALECEPGRRAAFLDEACAQDPALRAEVASLLSAHANLADLSNCPWPDQSVDFSLEGLVIGPYRLVKKLGEGGMGQVWLAEQTDPVRRQVALKLIRGGIFSAALLQRFQAERQSLAIMDHPAIAKVFDAGTTAQGQPYFVMEYVEGLPITKYCDQKRLSIRERLRLFIEVCDGIQHAHQKAIIHRDIKPANVLVVEVGGKPSPRIIDFGLAKTIVPAEAGGILFTQVGVILGTPGYTSPEQADPTIRDIDTRTDVYSLGVVLYELLTGALPFDPQAIKKQSYDKILRRLREEDPLIPSVKASKDSRASSSHAQMRATSPKQLTTLLRGDLDWITMKALERDRARRYGTPSELTADVERYLENRPVMARPASPGYRLQKYLRRNRVAVSFVSGALVLLLAFTGIQAIQLRRITRERDRANRVTDFMTNMFKVSDPSESRGNSITAREILDKSSKEIETGLAKDPQLQAQMMNVMGEVYINLGLHDDAKSLLEQSIAIRRRVFGLRNRETLDSMDKLAWLLEEQGKPEEAEKIERQILPIRMELFGPEDRDTLSSQVNLANDLCDEGKYAESEQIDRQAIAVRRRIAPDDPLTPMEMSNLAATIAMTGRYRESEQVNLEALAILNRTVGPDHPFTIKVRSNLADVYDREGRFAEAEQITRETLEVRRRILGPEHPDTLQNSGDLGTLLYEQGRYQQAEEIHRDVLARQKRLSGAERPQTLLTMDNLAADLAALHRYLQAEQLSREAWEIRQRVLGPDHPDTLLSAVHLGVINRLEGHYAQAEKLTSSALVAQRKALGDTHANCASSEYNLALIAAAQGHREDALALLQTALSHQFGQDVSRDLQSDALWKPFQSDAHFAALVSSAKQPPVGNSPTTP
ncbi:MAG TPA: serine/threonine-protein kinase [Candidatus Acidoferrum sp.]|nr:serine/threonine-protein kinase [Candidatus Acidoferrum sp.]